MVLPVDPNNLDDEWASLPDDLRGVIGFPGRFALRLRGHSRNATRYGDRRPLHSVGPTDMALLWKVGIAWIQEFEGRLARPLRFKVTTVTTGHSGKRNYV